MGYSTLPGASSAQVNSQLVPWVRTGNYFPRPLSASGPGGISSGVTATAFPPQTAGPGVSSSVGASSSMAAGSSSSGNPWSFTDSPVPWIILFFVGGVVLLRFVHHGY